MGAANLTVLTHLSHYLKTFGLRGLLCVLIIHWRASEASETLSGVYQFELVRHMYPTNGEVQTFSFKYIPDAIFITAHMSKYTIFTST